MDCGRYREVREAPPHPEQGAFGPGDTDAATRAAGRGATAHQLMAIFGWRTIKQAEFYTRPAERKRLAGAAMHLLGTDAGRESLTSGQQRTPVREKGRK